jgi:mannan endo-1,4-beta-mannosidase
MLFLNCLFVIFITLFIIYITLLAIFDPMQSFYLKHIISKVILRRISFLMILLCALGISSFAAPVIYQAETGTLTGTNTSTATAGYTGTGYVTGFDATGDAVQITVNVVTYGNYRIYIRYRSPLGEKTQDLYVNGSLAANVVFPSGTAWATVSSTSMMNAGNNTVSIRNSWGYVDIDNIGIEAVPPNVYNIVPNPINPATDAKTKALYNLLRSQFGECIFTGQTDYWNELIAITGEAPAVRGFDMQNYSPMNPWGWSGCCPAWGPWDDGRVQDAINWYNSTGGKGIVTFHWHWFSPSGGNLQTSTFYTANTTFDVSRAVVTTNPEYTQVIRDIDAIAVQLKRLQTAGVPVLWRPLHEAGGAWFWWGAKGAAPCLALWDIMYDRLTNYHGINNLLWVWSTPEPAWYPGNSKVDVIGYDSYPGAYNYTTQKGMFDQLYGIVGGQKLIALTENGPIPNINQAFLDDAPWSYFMSWVDLVTAQNTNAHIIDAFNQGCNLADVVPLPVTLVSFSATPDGNDIRLDWQTSQEEHNDYFEIERSVDGINFNTISRVEGQLSGTLLQSYQFLDQRYEGTMLYYRLKQVDVDGKFNYSSVITVHKAQENNRNVYPNPGMGVYKLKSSSAITSYKIINTEGKIISSLFFEDINEKKELEIDISSEPSGVYFLEVSEGTERTTQTLIKQ